MREIAKPCFGPHFLRQWREHAEYTLEDAGDAVGLSHAQLSRIERRLQEYGQVLLEKLATLYGTTPEVLISRDPKDLALWQEIDRYAEFVRLKQRT